MSIYKPGRPIKYNPSTNTGQKPPTQPGKYRVRDENGNITYVGETKDLSRRTRRKHEQHSIVKHKPTLNKSKGGEGIPAKYL